VELLPVSAFGRSVLTARTGQAGKM